MKADELQLSEGSNPDCVIASIRDTTGILDQSMCLKGELGNTSASSVHRLGEPKSFLVENKVNGVPPERKTPGNESSSNLSNDPGTGHEKN